MEPGPFSETRGEFSAVGRKLTVLQRVAHGMVSGRSPKACTSKVTTVETLLSRIKVKLGLRSGDELKRMAARWAG